VNYLPNFISSTWSKKSSNYVNE